MRVALVSSSSTIAAAVAGRIADHGGSVFQVNRLDSASDSLPGSSGSRECDITNFDAVSEALVHAQESLGGLDGVVNCAGSMPLKPAHMTSQAGYEEAIAVNLTTAFAVVHATGKLMAKEGGSVVLVSSAAATLGMANHEAIAAAKGGVEALARSAAATYASRGIRFNTVAPGLTETRMTASLTGNTVSRGVSESVHPLGRIGQPEDVASAIYWLLHPDQSWVTGQSIGVDGGLSRVQPRPRVAAGAR